MKNHNLSTFIPYLHLSIFAFFLLPKISFCVDPLYEACAPRQCGRHHISYPFYIQNHQQSFCGYPGFELNCSNSGNPIIYIPENDYIVEQIFYTNHSLRIYNAAVLSSKIGCLPRIQNITLESGQFNFTNVSELVLLSNCSPSTLTKTLSRYKVGCSDENGGVWDLAMFGDDGNLRSGIEQCGLNVVAPVEVYGGDSRGGGGVGEYEELLRRGFVLNWRASECSVCEESGGRCGFNYSTYHFRCFCHDRPHARFCLPRSRRKLVIEVAIGTSAAGVAITIVLFCYFWRKCSSFKSMICWIKKNEDHEDMEATLRPY